MTIYENFYIQGNYYIKNFEYSDKFIPPQIAQMVILLPNTIKVIVFQQFFFKIGERKQLIKAFDGEFLVKYTKPNIYYPNN